MSVAATEGVLSPPSRRREAGGHAADGRAEAHRASRWAPLALSLGALGVVYGDIGTSPLYTIQLIFSGDHPMAPSPVRVYGALSLIFWALMVVVTLKYVLLILRVDNHGEGGIMALVALIERVTKTRRKTGFVIIGVLGASLFYGDGMLTPAISVVSAVSGLNVASPTLAAQIVPFSLVILIALFALQRFGTGAVGGLFGPIMVVWFLVLGALGLKEVAANPSILRAVSPTYAAQFVVGDPKMGFFALGSVFLAVTGAEAIYADMGHFGRKAITRAWLCLAFPALLLNYMGQGALILARPETVSNPFFFLVPGGQTGQKAMVVLATVATVIASQAVISGAFSVTQQVIQLGFLPRMSIRHTSKRIIGQIYIPVVNWLLLASVIVLVLTFRSPTGLANAYGIALSAIFATNTLLAFVVFRVLWRKPLRIVIPGAAFFILIELTFFAANLTKIMSGGWFPLVVGAIFFTILTTWHRGRLMLGPRDEGGPRVAAPVHQPDDRRAAKSHPGHCRLPHALARHGADRPSQQRRAQRDRPRARHPREDPHRRGASRRRVRARHDRTAAAGVRGDHRRATATRTSPTSSPRSSWPSARGWTSTSTARPTTSTTSPSSRPAVRAWPAGGSASSPSCIRTRRRWRARTTSRPTACSRSAPTSSCSHDLDAVVARTQVPRTHRCAGTLRVLKLDPHESMRGVRDGDRFQTWRAHRDATG